MTKTSKTPTTKTPKAAAKAAPREAVKTAPAKPAPGKSRKAKTAAPQIVGSGDSARVTVPLAALTPSPDNVRRYQSEAGLSELVASIAAHGLLQNLTVRPKGGTFEVVAGARRLAALKTLAKQAGSGWTDESPVPVKLLSAENDAEISLAENTVRENMHSADQIEAFRKLIEDEGMTPEAVGDRFGISHMTVRRRVKLAKVSPAIMDDFRAGKVTLEIMQALAVSDDHGEQERVLAALPHWQRNADQVRNMLTREKIAVDHRLVAFVGLDAYQQAGGTITRDLFSDEGDGYLDDKALVMRLATERVNAEADAIKTAEGWKWAEGYLSETDARTGYLPSLATTERDLNDAERAELEKLTEWMEENEAAYEAGQMTDDEEAEYTRNMERIDAINEGLITHDPEEIPFAGVRVFITHDGALGARRGLLKTEDAHALEARRRLAAQADDDSGSDDEADKPTDDDADDNQPEAEAEEEGAAYSAALISDLSATKGAALSLAVAKRSDVALALVVHRLALTLLYSYASNGQSCIKIGASEWMDRKPSVIDHDNAGPFDAFEAERQAVAALLPKEPGDLWDWCVEADHKTLLRVLAMCAALRLDIRVSAPIQTAHPSDRDKIVTGNKIARLVGLDMADHWQPSEAFMKRTTKAQIAEAATEAGASKDAVRAMIAAPKAETIRLALETTKGRRWLPAPLRVPVPLAEQIAAEAAERPGPEAGAQDDATNDDTTQDEGETKTNATTPEGAADADASPAPVLVYGPALAPFFAGLPAHVAREATDAEQDQTAA
jgi:ParB family chromosome partitioning protein